MVLLVLHVKARLENVARLQFPAGHDWVVDVRESGGEETRKNCTMTTDEEFDVPNSRGTCHFVVRFGGGKRSSTISIQQVKNVTRDITAEDSERFVPVVAFECRGTEPVLWHPTGDYNVTAAGGGLFDDVSLEDGEWCGFDEKKGDVVGIYDLEHKFEVQR